MTAVDTLFTRARLEDGSLVDIAVEGGRIASITPAGGTPAPAAAIVDLAAMLVVPPFVEGHIHLDTSFVGEAWKPHKPCTQGFDVRERVRFQEENLATAAPMDYRAAKQIDLCLAAGTLRMRSHIHVDGGPGLSHLEKVLPVRERYRDLIDIQLVAFPQNGVLSRPGSIEAMDAAIRMGCDLVGGLDPATIDRDVKGQLEAVFAIAERHGVPVDIHLHDPHMLGVFQIEEICARTRALGMQGKVAVSHAYGLGEVPETAARKAADLIAASGVAIMTNAPGAHPFPPVALLRAAGVAVFSGSDNIRDSWWPYGDGDMLNRANMIGYRSGFYTDPELVAAFDVVTRAGATVLGLDDYGLRPGNAADFVCLAADLVPEAVASVPKRRKVYRRGRLIAEDFALTVTV